MSDWVDEKQAAYKKQVADAAEQKRRSDCFDDLLAALRLAQNAMRAPLDDWKGVLERKAIDAAREVIAKATQESA